MNFRAGLALFALLAIASALCAAGSPFNGTTVPRSDTTRPSLLGHLRNIGRNLRHSISSTFTVGAAKHALDRVSSGSKVNETMSDAGQAPTEDIVPVSESGNLKSSGRKSVSFVDDKVDTTEGKSSEASEPKKQLKEKADSKKAEESQGPKVDAAKTAAAEPVKQDGAEAATATAPNKADKAADSSAKDKKSDSEEEEEEEETSTDDNGAEEESGVEQEEADTKAADDGEPKEEDKSTSDSDDKTNKKEDKPSVPAASATKGAYKADS